MKRLAIIFILFALLIFGLSIQPISAHNGHSNDPIRTWADPINSGDSYSFTIDTYEENGKTVENGTVREGSEIEVDVIGNLTEIDVSSLEGILFTDYSNYFQVTVDDVSSEKFDIKSAFLFLYPVIRDEGNGSNTNIFQEAVDEDESVLLYPFTLQAATEIDGDDFTAELVTQDFTYKYNYDLSSGILNSYSQREDNSFIEISGDFSIDEVASFPFVPIFTGVALLVLINKSEAISNRIRH